MDPSAERLGVPRTLGDYMDTQILEGRTGDDAPVVLFVSDNGHGLGHLTRLLAIAERARGRFRPTLLTLSEAFPVVERWGHPVEYIPSYRKLALARASWAPMFARRLVAILHHVQPRVVVVDHIHPVPVIGAIRARTRGVDWIWSRRGMWRRGRNVEALAISECFDVVMEPGDVAAAVDAGATTWVDEAVTVPPIMLIEPDAMYPRQRARRELGLPEEGRVVLIQLSGDTPDKLARLITLARDVVRHVAGAETTLFAPLHILHRGRLPDIEGVVMKPVYPIARYLRAFDAAISTAGYNSYHELVASGVPAVFVARDTNSLDDQRRRAEFAELTGRAHFAESLHSPEFRSAVAKAMEDGEAEIAAAVARELGPFHGASVAADLICDRIRVRETEPHHAPTYEDLGVPKAPLYFRPTTRDLDADPSQWPTVGYLLIGCDPERAMEQIQEASEHFYGEGGFKPVFLVSGLEPSMFRESGFQFETVLDKEQWARIGRGSYEDYLGDRIHGFIESYQVSQVVDLRPSHV